MLIEQYEIYQKLTLLQKDKFFLKEICEDIFEHYGDLEDIFNEIIPAVFSSQARTKNAREIFPTLEYKVKKIQTVGKRKIIPHLEHAFSDVNISYNEDQLTEMLYFYSQFCGLFLDISSESHAVALYVTPEGEIKYNDSNLNTKENEMISEKRDIVGSIKEVVRKIIKNMYHANSIYIDFPIYFSSWEFENIPIKNSKKSFINPSPNYFSPLHYAIMLYGVQSSEVNKNSIFDVFYQDPWMLFMPDAHHRTPFMFLGLLKESEILPSLINKLTKKNFQNHNNPIKVRKRSLIPILAGAYNKKRSIFFLLYKRRWREAPEDFIWIKS